MDISRLPEPLRRRAEELERLPTVEKVGVLAELEMLREVLAEAEQRRRGGKTS